MFVLDQNLTNKQRQFGDKNTTKICQFGDENITNK